jgi:hypothetical protein
MKHTLPAAWAPYLMYGETECYLPAELQEMKEWQQRKTDARPRSCDNVSFGIFNHQLRELLDFYWG